jgi:hypothetical protein
MTTSSGKGSLQISSQAKIASDIVHPDGVNNNIGVVLSQSNTFLHRAPTLQTPLNLLGSGLKTVACRRPVNSFYCFETNLALKASFFMAL